MSITEIRLTIRRARTPSALHLLAVVAAAGALMGCGPDGPATGGADGAGGASGASGAAGNDETAPLLGGIFYTWYYDEKDGVRDGKHTRDDWTELGPDGEAWRPRPDSAKPAIAQHHIELMKAAKADLMLISWGFGQQGWFEHFERAGHNYARECNEAGVLHAAWVDGFQDEHDKQRALDVLKLVAQEPYYLTHPKSGKPVVFLNGASYVALGEAHLGQYFEAFHPVLSTGQPEKLKRLANGLPFDMCLYNGPYLATRNEYESKIASIRAAGIDYWHIPFWQFQNAHDNTEPGKTPHRFPQVDGEVAPWALDGVVDERDLEFDESQWRIGHDHGAIGFVPAMNERGESSSRVPTVETGRAIWEAYVARGEAWP